MAFRECAKPDSFCHQAEGGVYIADRSDTRKFHLDETKMSDIENWVKNSQNNNPCSFLCVIVLSMAPCFSFYNIQQFCNFTNLVYNSTTYLHAYSVVS
jgi:hypothetical protein